MKKILQLILVFLSVKSFAQFKTIHSDRTTFFKCSDTFMDDEIIGNPGSFIPVQIQNLRVVNSDTLYNNFRILSYTGSDDYECKVTNKGYAWTGKNIIMTKDYQEIFINSGDDSLIFKKYANVNDSWIFYRTEQNYFEAKVTGKKLETFSIYKDEVTDSVLTFSISLKRNENNSALAHPFNGKEWKISKKYGFVKTYDLLHFPEDTNALILAGVDKFNIGVQNLTEKEIYDFEVGDELHIKEFAIYEAIVENKIRQTILMKTFSNNSVDYQIEVLENKTRKNLWGGEETFTVNIDTISLKISLTSDLYGINQLPLKQIEKGWASYNFQFLNSGDPSVMVKSTNEGYHSSMGSTDDSCYSEIITLSPVVSSNDEYWQGLGGPYYDRVLGIVQVERRQLVYYKKGTTKEGEPIDFVLGLYPNKLSVSVSLSPNPATDKIKISSEGIQNTYYKIFNNEGREVLSGNFSTTEETIEINSLRAGIYSVMILNEGGVVYTSRLVKN
ncbi:T9SS type A sorting domain-containing protein [Sporocytophaga myxococcoides]|uniref:T9SS type A sorting domain-containing protein n=1 Tax=Sporocytophaga myxococcoides TaxID=153721 RepID=UPI000492198B|nr:T9SS type A sorting domain-containing protein [Sporocytophaga myxococcoides]